MDFIHVIKHRFFWTLCGIFYLFSGSTAVYGAEISDLVMNTDQGYLLLSVKISDVIAGDVNGPAEAEASATIIFSIALYEVKTFWFNKKLAHHTATNTIKHLAAKKVYQLLRSWDSGPPKVVDSLNEARLLAAEVNHLKLMPLAGLEKDRTYQVRVRAVCQDKNAHFLNSSGGFKTDWHTVDFAF